MSPAQEKCATLVFMDRAREFFQNKKVTLMGLGLLGRGVGDARFIAECAAHVLVTDKKSETELAESLAQLKGLENISYRLGEHREEDFTSADMVIKAAGVPLNNQYIEAAKKAEVPVYMSTALFAQFAREVGATLVGVTGTRGKSTTAHLIFHVLQQAGRRAHLGGNVRGLSTLALLPQVQAGDTVVLELDSWQLQGFGDAKLSPHIAVFTNLMPDHQNYYPDMDTYFMDKANIFTNQHLGDVLVCGESIEGRIRSANPPVAPTVPTPLSNDWQLQIPGEHNRENAALAREALRALGIGEGAIQDGFATFAGVEGRLQLVREVGGVKVYNDNNATTPDATLAALKALDNGKRSIILIVGGSDKGLEVTALLGEIARVCKRVICLAGTGTNRITPFMQDFSLFDSLEAAVQEALHSAQPGDTVLFSPAFASFGMFKNEYERNDQFVHLIDLL